MRPTSRSSPGFSMTLSLTLRSRSIGWRSSGSNLERRSENGSVQAQLQEPSSEILTSSSRLGVLFVIADDCVGDV